MAVPEGVTVVDHVLLRRLVSILRDKGTPHGNFRQTLDEAAMLLAYEAMRSLRPVDHAVIFGEDTPEAALARLRPDVHCKGADYAPPDGKPVPERDVVEGYGGTVAFLPLVAGRSSTRLVEALEAGA